MRIICLCAWQSLLASASWDGTVRLWDPFRAGTSTEILRHSADCLDVAWRPDARQLCVATRDGQLSLWDPKEGRQQGVVNARADAAAGRRAGDVRAAGSSTAASHFASVEYSADGQLLIAGGRSNYVCVFAVEERLLLRKFPLTHNRDLDGVTMFLNSGRLTGTGLSKDLMDDPRDERTARTLGELVPGPDKSLPGATRATDPTARRALAETRCRCVRFSPTGASFAAATVEGLLVFSVDEGMTFDPVALDLDVTPATIRAALAGGDPARALAYALHLGEPRYIRAAVLAIKPQDLPLVAPAIPSTYSPRLLEHLATLINESHHVERAVTLAVAMMTAHSSYLRAHPAAAGGPLREVLRAVASHRDSLGRLATDNSYMLAFVGAAPLAATSALDL